MDYPPIILFTYNRLNTLETCINSLKACDYSNDSELIIYSDGPCNPADSVKVGLVREYIKTLKGFKSVNIVLREKNFGVDFNIIEAIKEISSSYNSFIVIEDDLIFSKTFISFMHQALEHYRSNKSVITISGFSYINNIDPEYLYDAYFTKRSGSWGWATWSDKIRVVNWELTTADSFMKSKKMQFQFNEWGSDLSSMLKKTIKGVIKAWDIRLCYHQFENDLYTVYPTLSLVRYNGFSSEASNTMGYDRYKKITINVKSTFKFPETVSINPSIKKKFVFKYSLYMRIYYKVLGLMGLK